MRLSFSVIVASLLLAGCGSGNSKPEPFSESDVRASVSEMMSGITEAAGRKDIAAFMNYWAKSDSTIYTRGGRTFVGWDEINENHTFHFSSPGKWTTGMSELFVRVLSSTAAVSTAFNTISSAGADGSTSSTWFILTATVELQGGEWKIVQAHSSYPDEGMTPRRTAGNVD